jgi:hypothetical protein
MKTLAALLLGIAVCSCAHDPHSYQVTLMPRVSQTTKSFVACDLDPTTQVAKCLPMEEFLVAWMEATMEAQDKANDKTEIMPPHPPGSF